eukprot:CAMPEP_0116827116 /NCGR_PEP_ID=MMETSP0418-20121206/2916_1 /TAXON_ID=1158023 /ORGANISM="Astrosyne radiata, Strain 13vi08-1A" /LENGTH=591 /DNA_ID=CAMNT_0004455847 /DNA_START=63 /DNA_END=1838 /DNA_ORIENTATION=+
MFASKNASDEEEASPGLSSGYCTIETVETSNGKKVLLDSMHIDLPEGTMTAILGPSGAGKTTIMNVLTDNVESNVRAVGEVSLPGPAAFVPQDDRLHGFFTSKSYLEHYSRLAGKTPNPQEIDNLLQDMGLTDQANTIVGDLFLKGLSGGQKRRLSIALEALTGPKNFFLDEPTSGLDAESALQVMEFLKDYARAAPGRRVILTIHQPSSFIWSLVDRVVLLSKGKLMYQGPRGGMEDFFAFAGHPTPPQYNPADHYVTSVNDEFRHHAMSVEDWAEKYNEFTKKNLAHSTKRTNSMLAAARKPEFPTHRAKFSLFVVFELVYRYFLNLWFNPGILFTRVAMYSMLALMVGALFFDLGDRVDFESIQSRTAVLFYCVAFFIFMSVAVLPFTVIERGIVDKEVRNGYYHPIFYQVAQGISSIPGTALLALLVTAIIIGLTGMKAPLWYYLTMFLSLICAEALAQLVSHVVPHFVIGMALVAGMYGFFMLFQGFMLVPSDFPSWLRWTYNVAFHTYAWRTFMFSEFHDRDELDSTQFPTGMAVLKAYEIEDVHRGNDMLVLVGYAIVLHLLSFMVLSLRYTLFKGKILPPKDQ